MSSIERRLEGSRRGLDFAGILRVRLADRHIRVFWRIDGFLDRRRRRLGGSSEGGVGNCHVRLHDIQMPTIGPKEAPSFYLEAGCGADARISAEVSVIGERRSVTIEPSAIPARKNVTAVWRSYSGRARFSVGIC